MTTSTPTITLSEAIATARKRAKMEQAELAEAIGVHEKTLGRWERDVTKQPPFAAIVRIAVATGQPLELFTSAIDTPPGRTRPGVHTGQTLLFELAAA